MGKIIAEWNKGIKDMPDVCQYIFLYSIFFFPCDIINKNNQLFFKNDVYIYIYLIAMREEDESTLLHAPQLYREAIYFSR